MQRPVQNVDMETKAPFKLLVKFADYECQSTRWNGFFHGADLVDTFLRTGLVVFQKVFHRAVALGVSCFLVPGVLGIHMVGIMLVVIHPLNFFKAEIRLFRVLPKFRGSEATVAVPVHIFLGSLGINVFAVFHIKPTVIVPGIIGAMLAGASVVPCQFQIPSLQSLLIFSEGEVAAKPPNLRVSASGNTQYELTQGINSPWARRFTLDPMGLAALNPPMGFAP
ncbi:hypothetical protein BACCAP_02489 [Pseudoflavonifractor capillosus ATCC 29799]|uniref:Uncharacterized protein n=1 Tax=Pseudoflavonifractor capillosus ATCC 29799 TaxID=411467 RepID=A6NW94_9FIRM|nr:hypothetical protein BACCAP_02489 [Pseudoflavonifractor capillosus ATCC 29799]